MKILFVLLGLLCATAAGAAGAMLFAPAPKSVETPIAAPAAPQAAAQVPAEVRDRIEKLAMEVADLQSRLDRAESAASRTHVAVADDAPKAAIDDGSSAVFAAQHRDAILKVIADERAEQERKREEERNKRDEEQRQQRAERMAQRFGLNAAQTHQLTDFYATERTKRDEMRASFDAQGADGDPQSMRDAFRQYGEWRESELVRLFGDAGKQISDYDSQRFRQAGFGGGGGGGGGPGGRRNGAGGGNGNNAGGPPAGPQGGGF